MNNILIRADGNIKVIDFDLMSLDCAYDECFDHGYNLMAPEELRRCKEYYGNPKVKPATGPAAKDKHGVTLYISAKFFEFCFYNFVVIDRHVGHRLAFPVSDGRDWDDLGFDDHGCTWVHQN